MENIKIIIAEDDGIIAADIKMTLENYGYSVCSIVSTGTEMIKKAEEERPDLVLTDIMLLGDVDGIEAAREIRNRFDIPVIYLTAYSDKTLLGRARMTEPLGYLVKPFEDRELYSTIEMAIYNHKIVKRMKEIDAWLHTTLKSIGDGVIATDPEGNVKFMNPVAQSLMGWREEDAYGRHLKEVFNLVNEESGEEETLPIEDVLREGKTLRLSNHILKRNGDKIFIADSAAPIKDDKESLIGVVVVFTDMTERKQMEKALKKYSETLKEKVMERTSELEKALIRAAAANRAKSEFLANMSHELRTPLNAIIGFSELLVDGMAGPITDKQKDFLSDVVESGRHLLGMINDILDLSKFETDETELKLKEFNLRKILERCLSMYKEKALKHNIKTSLDIENGIETIMADERKTKQVILHLLGNAFKFTPDGGSVHVAARKTGGAEVQKHVDLRTSELSRFSADTDFVEISVEDTGIGISSEDQKRLFQPFQQLEATLTKKYAGTGLGLNLCKRIIELHGGKIWVESDLGKGSRFTFVIPVQQPSEVS